jgi:hypothetical protein
VVRDQLATLLRQRPPAPIELSSPDLLPAIFERVIASAEAGATGALLRQEMPVQPAAAGSDAAPEPLESPLAMALLTRPDQPSTDAWDSVRGAILSSHRAMPVAAGASRGRWLGIATVAAAAMVYGILLSDGTRAVPNIVFTDVASMPDVEFVVLRHGIPR